MNGTLFSYTGKGGDVVIPDSVTAIGSSVFSGREDITSVTIPDSVQSISYDAFYGCTGLTSVRLPEGLTYIPGELFAECENLTSVSIPSSVETIDNRVAFANTAIRAVVLPEGLNYIGYGVFAGCDGLTTVDIPASVKTIGRTAFDCAGLTDVYVYGSDVTLDYGDNGGEQGLALGNPGITTIHGIPGSAAQEYAETYGYAFEVLSVTPSQPLTVSASPITVTESLEQAGLDTTAKVEEALTAAVAGVDGFEAENVVTYEAALKVSYDNGVSWVEATADNFPADGLTVTLPYPEDTDGENYEFVVTHMFTVDGNDHKAGDVEVFSGQDITMTEDGLQITVTSLSPMAVAWKQTAVEPEPAETTAPETTAPETPAPAELASETEGSRSITLWVVVALVCVAGLGVVTLRRKKQG